MPLCRGRQAVNTLLTKVVLFLIRIPTSIVGPPENTVPLLIWPSQQIICSISFGSNKDSKKANRLSLSVAYSMAYLQLSAEGQVLHVFIFRLDSWTCPLVCIHLQAVPVKERG